MKKVLFTLVAMLFAVTAFATTGRYSVSPTSGSTIKSISSITLQFLEKTTSTANTQILENAVVDDATGNGVGNVRVSADGKGGATLTMQTPITKDGNYTITIPAETFIFDISWEPYYVDANDEIKLHYTVKSSGGGSEEGQGDGPITMIPAKGATVQSFSSFTLMFNEASEVTFNSNAFEDSYVNVYSDGMFCSAFYKNVFNNNGGKTVTGSLSASYAAVLTEAGSYTFTIPAGVYTIDGTPSEEIVFAFTIDPNAEEQVKPDVIYSTNPTNKEKVESFSTLTVSFNGPEATISNYNDTFAVNVTDVVGTTIAKAFSVRKNSANSYTISFTADAAKRDYFTNGQLTKPGVYKALLPKGLFTHTFDGFDDKDPSEAIEVEFTIPGSGDEPLPYVNAEIGYTINPASGSTITDETKNTFTITFDAPVTLDMDETYLTSGSQIIEFVNVSSNGNAYTFTFPSAWLTSVEYRSKVIDAQIAANDAASGHRVLGNAGEGENSLITVHYDVNIGGEPTLDLTPVLTPATGSSVETLTTVEVRYNGPAGFAINEEDDASWVTLTDAAGTTTIDADMIEITNGGFAISFVGVPAGTYTMVVPEGLFRYQAVSGGEFLPLAEVRATYTVTKGEELPVVSAQFTATPADGSTVAACASICFAYAGSVDLAEASSTVAPVLTDAAGQEVALSQCELVIDEAAETCSLVATPAATLADGVYTFAVPERYLMSYDAEGTPVAYLAAHQVTFTVQTPVDGVQTITVLTEGEGVAYDVAGRRIANGHQGIVIRGGQKIIRK